MRLSKRIKSVAQAAMQAQRSKAELELAASGAIAATAEIASRCAERIKIGG